MTASQEFCIDILNLRYRGSVEDDVHRALADRLKQIRDVFGTIPDTIEDVWVATALGEKQAAQRLIDAVPRQHPFELRYGRLPAGDEWSRCEQVLNRLDLVEVLRKPWGSRSRPLRAAAALTD